MRYGLFILAGIAAATTTSALAHSSRHHTARHSESIATATGNGQDAMMDSYDPPPVRRHTARPPPRVHIRLHLEPQAEPISWII